MSIFLKYTFWRGYAKTPNLEGFEGSGADWLEIYKPYIEDGETVITSPHKVYGYSSIGYATLS